MSTTTNVHNQQEGDIPDDAPFSKEEAWVDVNLLHSYTNLEQALEHFSKKAGRYERVMTTLGYPGPERTADSIQTLYPGNSNVKILDVAAGTGLVGQELSKRGYTSIDAIDATPAMLKRAKDKNIYKNLYCHLLGETPMPLKDNSYDIVTIGSGFAKGIFLPVNSMDDIIRVVKPGGHVINVAPLFYLDWYINEFEAHMIKLQEQGKWKQLTRIMYPDLVDGLEGCIYIHKVM